MRTTYRAVAIAFCVATGAAWAQQQAAPQHSSVNPFARGDKNSFFYGSLQGPLSSENKLGRPIGQVAPVTPVPEPSEWALMAAGLALVSYIVRRSSKRDP
jgi:hypothetical protein